jgi:hypothetical protein
MTKLGLPDIEMRGVPIDHKTVALFLVEAVARRLWDEGWTNDIEIDGFGETFIVRLSEPKPGCIRAAACDGRAGGPQTEGIAWSRGILRRA